VDGGKHRLHVGGEAERRLRLFGEVRKFLGAEINLERLHVVFELCETARTDDDGGNAGLCVRIARIEVAAELGRDDDAVAFFFVTADVIAASRSSPNPDHRQRSSSRGTGAHAQSGAERPSVT
jgi:hypothetical protein